MDSSREPKRRDLERHKRAVPFTCIIIDLIYEALVFGVTDEKERAKIYRWLFEKIPPRTLIDKNISSIELFFNLFAKENIEEMGDKITDIAENILPRDKKSVRICAHDRLEVLKEYFEVLLPFLSTEDELKDDLGEVHFAAEFSGKSERLEKLLLFHWKKMQDEFKTLGGYLSASLTSSFTERDEDEIIIGDVVRPLCKKIVVSGLEEAVRRLPYKSITRCIAEILDFRETFVEDSPAHEHLTVILKYLIAVEGFENIKKYILHTGDKDG